MPFLSSSKLMLVHARSFNISSLFPNYRIIRSYIVKAIDRIIQNLQKNVQPQLGIKKCSTSQLYTYRNTIYDRLCGLVVRVPGYRSRGPGSIPSATRFSEK
jgi:hypothetical protein